VAVAVEGGGAVGVRAGDAVGVPAAGAGDAGEVVGGEGVEDAISSEVGVHPATSRTSTIARNLCPMGRLNISGDDDHTARRSSNLADGVDYLSHPGEIEDQ
jgi:hypothetical protein